MEAIWFLSHVLNLLPVRFTQQNSRCIRKSAMKHMEKPDRKSDFPCFSYGYQKCMFVDFSTAYTRFSQLCSLRSVEKFIVFEHAYFDVYSLILIESHTNQIQGIQVSSLEVMDGWDKVCGCYLNPISSSQTSTG